MADQNEQFNQLVKDLSLSSEQFPLEDVVPVFVPDSLAEGDVWLGPIVKMQASKLAITWACLMPYQTMQYISYNTAQYWESQNIDWRSQSMENLVRMSEEMGTHSFRRDDETYYGLVMMYEDGIGPSRLLLNGILEELFPEGYLLAIPERSIGVVLSRAASPKEKETVESFVEKCFEEGTQPFKRDFFDPDLLMEADPD